MTIERKSVQSTGVQSGQGWPVEMSGIHGNSGELTPWNFPILESFGDDGNFTQFWPTLFEGRVWGLGGLGLLEDCGCWPDLSKKVEDCFPWLKSTQFLQKEKSQKIIEYLKKGYTHNEISKILRCSPSTIQKVKGIVKYTNIGLLKISNCSS